MIDCKCCICWEIDSIFHDIFQKVDFLTTTLKMMTANQSAHCILYDCACIIIIVQGCGLKFSNTHGCVWASLCTYNYAPFFQRGQIVLHFSVDNLLACSPSDVRSIYFDPLAWKLPNLVQWMPLESRCFLLISRSHGQRSRSNRWSLHKWYYVCSLSVDPFAG